MKKLTTSQGVFGPYFEIIEAADRYEADGVGLPFTVVGMGVIADSALGDFPPAQPDPAELQATIVNATQARLDTFAATRNYDGILSACTYASSVVPKFAQEGQAAINARDATWATLYTILGEVQSGKRPMPGGYTDIESELPALAWNM